MLTIGLVINPYAGIGGPMALKGSDNIDIDEVLSQGGQCLSSSRVAVTLAKLGEKASKVRWLTAPSKMGEDLLKQHGFAVTVVGEIEAQHTTAKDTERLVTQLIDAGIDLLLFAGGDGTARNVVNACQSSRNEALLVLGIPAGVKMHSGVYAVSPQAAAEVLHLLIDNDVVSTGIQEVRDIDEEALRAGQLNSRYYGELRVPNDQRYVQQVKNSGRQNEDEIQLEIAAGVVDDMDNETLYIIGCGTTPKAIMDELHLPNTLLGVDVVLGREVIAMDVSALCLESLLLEQYPHHPAKLLITAIGGQGHIIGRGNQQISAKVLRRITQHNTVVLITPSKLAELVHRPLLMDSGDALLDREWAGLMTVHTGYQQTAVYPLNSGQS
ncbi:MAG: putative polyphosphate/ATP-dependent NAD kinase [Candidatus Endobugula sp.]|jgi:predicted polyphosphate/ATP-dependent NAD kinase